MTSNALNRIIKAVEQHREAIDRLQAVGLAAIAAAADAVETVFRNGGRVYICGNGGSAADAQHIAAELAGRFERDRRPLPAVALTTDTSLLTAVANDYGYDLVFPRQVEAFVRAGDLLWAISTSGQSPGVVAAAELASKKGATVLAFTGRAGSRLETIADICVCSDCPSTATSQEIHQLAYHAICAIVEDSLFSAGDGSDT